jgi:nucleotide-binding universal stress UspA family protein
MMEILVCLEDSASSASAVSVAVDLARALPANLVGLAIVDEPDIVAGSATSIGGASFRKDRNAALIADAHQRARGWLDDFVAHGRAARVAVRALEITGSAAEMILAEVPRHDITVLGRDANFRFETHEHDRHTRDRILRRAGKPVIVVPERVAAAGPAVMIAYDGSSAAVRAMRSFAASGIARGREVHVASVDDDGANAFQTATAGCELLKKLGVHAVPENVVSSEPIAAALLSRRARIDAGLIVLGGYIPSPLARLVWGSVTSEIVEHAVVPVFLHY